MLKEEHDAGGVKNDILQRGKSMRSQRMREPEQISHRPWSSTSCSDSVPALSEEELNKLSASILRAEMLGDTEMASRLKKQLSMEKDHHRMAEGDKSAFSGKGKMSTDVLVTPNQNDSGVKLEKMADRTSANRRTMHFFGSLGNFRPGTKYQTDTLP